MKHSVPFLKIKGSFHICCEAVEVIPIESVSSANNGPLQRHSLVLLDFLMCIVSPLLSATSFKLTGSPAVFWLKTKFYGARRTNAL